MVSDSRDVPDGALPTFIVIGAMKSGTTSLARYLGAHPDVFMTSPKEPQFFNKPRNWERGVEWYRSLFAGAGAARARGEATPSYAKAPMSHGVPERIATVVPDVKLIYLLRDPVERIQSHYQADTRRLEEHRSIDEAVLEDAKYVDFSRYAYQLELYLEHFDRSQILVLWSDDLKDRRAATVARAFGFIGVDADVAPVATLSEEFRRADRHTKPTWLNAPAYRLMASTPLRRLPVGVRHRLGRVAQRQSRTADTALSPDVTAHLWEQLVPDGRRLEALIGETPPWLAGRESEAGA